MTLKAGLLILATFFGTHAMAQEQGRRTCFYDRVYCKARTDRIAIVRGPTVKVKSCNLEAAVAEAMTRLNTVCGGHCQTPISCVALDDTAFETEISYTPR